MEMTRKKIHFRRKSLLSSTGKGKREWEAYKGIQPTEDSLVTPQVIDR
jgi:hypothetical protein